MQKPSVQNWFYQNRSILLKFLLCLFFVFEGQEILAQTDSTDQLKFDVGITRNKNRHLWPIIYRENNEESKDLQLAFSLYQRYEKTDSSLFHSHLLPMYWHTFEPNNTTLKIGTVYYPSLFEYSADTFQNRKTYRIGSLLPGVDLMNISRSNNGLFIENNVFFFVYSKIDVVRQKSHVVVFPLYWYYKNKFAASHTLFPIFRIKTSLREKNVSVFPLLTFYSLKNDTNANSRGKIKSISQDKTLWSLFYFRSVWKLNTFQQPGLESSAIQTYQKITQFYPLVFWKKTDETKKLVVFPFYFRTNDYRDNDFSRTYAGLLYFSKKTPSKSINAFFPFWYVRNSQYGTNVKIITPLFYAGNSRKWNFVALFPLFGNFRSHYSKGDTISAITPFIWTRKSDKTFTANFYPFVFYKHNEEYGQNRFTLFPLIFWNSYSKHWNRGQSTRLVVFPFLSINSQQINKNDKSRIDAVSLFPIFYWKHLKNNNGEVVLQRIYAGMIFYHKKSEQLTKNILFPIYWHIDNAKTNAHFRSFALIYWHSKNPENQFQMVFPFYAQYKEKGGDTATAITPFIWFTKNKMKSSVNFVPFYFSSVNKNGNYSKFILPLYFHWNNADERVKLVLPFYYSQYDKAFKETISSVLPLYWVHKTDYGDVNRVLFPLLWASSNNKSSSFTIFPFYYQSSQKDISEKIKLLVPIFYTHKNLTDTTLVLFPLIWKNHNKETQSLVLPFYIHINDVNLTIYSINSYGYLFWKFKGLNTSKHFLFPLYYSSRTYFGRPINKEILHSTLAITPLYWRSNYLKKGQDGWVQNRYLLPIYWSKTTATDKTMVLASLFFMNKTKTKFNFEKRALLLPIYYRIRVKSVFPGFGNLNCDYKFTAITPLFFNCTEYNSPYISEKEIQQGKAIQDIDTSFSRETMLFPLFYNKLTYNLHKPSEQNRISGVTPLYWHIKTPYRNHIRFWPIFNYVRDIDNELHFNILYGLFRQDFDSSIHFKSTAIIWPLIQNEHDNGVHRFHIAPLLWVKNAPNHSYNVLFPLYSWSKKDNTTRMSFLWQLYKYKAIEGQMSGHRFLFRAYLRDRYTNGDFETRLLHKVYVNMHKDSAIEKAIFPLYSKRIRKNGDYYKWYALGLFSKSKTKIPGTKEFYLEEKLLWFIRFRSNAGYLKSKGIQFKKGN